MIDSNSSGNLPWVEKYRPNNLSELVSQEEIINTIKKLINENRLPHLLFYGPPGTGKTSTILAAARELFTRTYLNSRVLELNASDERGINIVRQKIIEFASTRGIQNTNEEENIPHIKLVILDEADAMTKDAQNALRRVIEKYTESTRFCIICNYLSKIIPALQSRCTRFRFTPLNETQMMPRLEEVIAKEKLNISESGRKAILRLSKGDMRKVMNVLQSTAMSVFPNEITEEAIYKCVGQPQPEVMKRILNVLWSKSINEAYEDLLEIRLVHGLALADLLEPLLDQLSMFQQHPEVVAFVLDKMANIETSLSTGCSEKIQILSLISAFIEARDLAYKLEPPHKK